MALRNLSYFGGVGPIDQIEQNIIWYLREQLLLLGGYFNIVSGFTGYAGENLSLLRPSFQPKHSNFQFWSGLSHQWVWESGLSTSSIINAVPIQVSGVYISNVFYPTATTVGTYEHYVDYSRGGIVFTNAQSSGSSIWCERTERAAFIYSALSDEYRSILIDHMRALPNVPGSGLDNYNTESRGLLPAIFVNIKKSNSVPYELGSLSNLTSYLVELDIITEHIGGFNKLRDICVGLEGYPLEMFDVNQASTGSYPLDYLGRLREGFAKIRSQLVDDLPWKNGKFLNNSRENIFPSTLPLHRGRVSLNFEILT